ncbi:MAG: hypothetical protein ACKOFH_08100, partial [Chthoniobacterales bacterium]
MLRDELEIALGETGKFKIVTRDRLADLQMEGKFQGKGVLEPGTGVEKVSIEGVKGIVRGRFYATGDEVTVFVELSVDRELYFEAFAPLLLKCLRSVTGSSGETFRLRNPQRREFYKGHPGGASEYFGQDVPFGVSFYQFPDEVLGPDKRIVYDKTMFVVEKATKNLDFLEGTMFRKGKYQAILLTNSQNPWSVCVEFLDGDGNLLAKGVTPIRDPFSLRTYAGYELPKGALCQVGPFLYTEAYGYDVIG